MTALDIWLLMTKITLFLELIEYMIVLHIRFSNATLNFFLEKRQNRKNPRVAAECSPQKSVSVIAVKCKRIDSMAFLGFLLGSIFINFVYFSYYW